MTDVDGAWSRDQLQTFLEEALMPLRLGCHHTSGGLWMLSLWYRYRDGQFQCATGKDSDVATFLREEQSVCFELSTNSPPYMGVRGNGRAKLTPDEDKELLGTLVERYLGGTDSELAAMLLADDRKEVAITIEPERLYTWDFTDRMGNALGDSPATTPGPDSPKYEH